MLTRVFDWLFRNRLTGETTIVQLPNVWLWIVIVAWPSRLLPETPFTAVVSMISTAALVVWALDEIVRGVNPWRRVLGGGVLAFTVVGMVVGR